MDPRPLAPRRARRASIVLVSSLALASCARRGAMPTVIERPPAPVSVAEAVQQDVPVYLDSIGRCVAPQLVSITPQVSGRIVAIHFEDGADVEAGDPLFTIDPRPYEARLASAKAQLAQAQAALELARIEFERVAGLVETRAVAQQDYDLRRNAVEVAEAELRAREAAVAEAELDVEYCSIHAPISGRAGENLVDIGNVVTANEDSLLVLQQLDPLEVDFSVPEGELTRVQASVARGAPEVLVRLPGDPGPPITGALDFIDNSVAPGTGTVQLRATVPNPDHRLWPGRFAEVRVVTSRIDDAVLVPAAAAALSAEGWYVLVVHEDSTAELRPIEQGQRQGELVVITSGVAAGERVVVEGQVGVMPGAKVRVVGDGEPPAATNGDTGEAESGS